jgi:hypothetical protein
MFSSGQLVFGVIFFIVFSAIIIYTYFKDKKLHARYYKGSIWILIAFIAFISLIALIKFMFS